LTGLSVDTMMLHLHKICDTDYVRETMKLFFCLLGLVLVLEGVPYFAFPDKMKLWMRKIQETPDPQLRLMGFGAMCAGLLLVYLFK